MIRIDWGKWSAVAEIVSSVAIVVTLAYLTVQTRLFANTCKGHSADIHGRSRGIVRRVLFDPIET